MSLPREVLPGRTYMITRRCTQRQFLMRPDPETNNAFLYCLIVAALRYQIEILFSVANSNHHHTGIYDPSGRYPDFLAYFHKLFAKCQNAWRGRWENFWSSEQTSVVRLVEADDALDKMIYALTNPVKDHLVEKAHHWPGFSSLQANLKGRKVTATRPRHFFRGDGSMPETVTVCFGRPDGYEKMSQHDFEKLLLRRIRAVETEAAAEREKSGRRLLGRRVVLRQSWRDRPRSAEPRRQMSPRVAAASKWSRIEALQRNKLFLEEYRAARDKLMAKKRNVLFPAGTYWLHRFAKVRCEPSPADPG